MSSTPRRAIVRAYPTIAFLVVALDTVNVFTVISDSARYRAIPGCAPAGHRWSNAVRIIGSTINLLRLLVANGVGTAAGGVPTVVPKWRSGWLTNQAS